MNAVAKEASNLDDVFASPVLSDVALTAIRRLDARYHVSFPGFDFYRLIAAGVPSPRVTSWAVMTARVLARAEKKNGRPYIDREVGQRTDWVDRAGLDALESVVNQRWPASIDERAKEFGIHWKTYKAVRDPVAAGMNIGLRMYQTQLHAEYVKVLWEMSRGS